MKIFLAAVVLAWLPGAVLAQSGGPRTLYWRALEVRAHLDADGRLHVRERHAMVFDGEWNGGERTFRVERGQRLQFEELSRIDARGGVHRLNAGDLGGIDQYRWIDDRTLRWRSRLPSDPPFRNTEQIFQIDYVLSNILVPRGDELVLTTILRFRSPMAVRLFALTDWDEAWQARSFAGHLERKNLPPGASVVLTLPFRYVGASTPAGVRLPAPMAARVLLILGLLAFIAWRTTAFCRHEKLFGRYAPLPPLARIDDAWLKEQVFKLRPEVVGAAWDLHTSTPEVAAVLARHRRGKSSEVRAAGPWFWRRDVAPRAAPPARSAQQLRTQAGRCAFFAGDATDTDAIREHYPRPASTPPPDPRRPVPGAQGPRRQLAALPGRATASCSSDACARRPSRCGGTRLSLGARATWRSPPLRPTG